MLVTETRDAPVTQQELDLTSRIYRLDLDEPVGWLGVTCVDFFARIYYVWFLPGPAFCRVKPRDLRRLWNAHRKHFPHVYAGIRRDNATAVRFAKFFGLKYMEPLDREADIYGCWTSDDLNRAVSGN